MPSDPLSAARTTPSKRGAETDLDREVERTTRIGEDQKHVFGERGRGAPDFNQVPDPGPPIPPLPRLPRQPRD